jgi:hypothetical protein
MTYSEMKGERNKDPMIKIDDVDSISLKSYREYISAVNIKYVVKFAIPTPNSDELFREYQLSTIIHATNDIPIDEFSYTYNNVEHIISFDNGGSETTSILSKEEAKHLWKHLISNEFRSRKGNDLGDHL